MALSDCLSSVFPHKGCEDCKNSSHFAIGITQCITQLHRVTPRQALRSKR
uniref:Uncharacterized protein n=1 Tax=Anguilla anguilla TaxID=7936 RepID=A0A0E9S005_ANGAN